jgi:riboflavin transporter FmnP
MFSAVAVILVLIFNYLPLMGFVPGAPFLTYEPKLVIITICSFILGPVSGSLVSLSTCILESLLIGGVSATPVAFIMNLVNCLSFASISGLIYKYKHDIKGAIIAMGVGGITATIMMLILNYYLYPVFSRDITRLMVVDLFPWLLLFNVLKNIINIALIILLYKPIINTLRTNGVIRSVNANQAVNNPVKASAIIAVILLFVALVVVFILNLI